MNFEVFIKRYYPNAKMSKDGFVKVSDICQDKTKLKIFFEDFMVKRLIKSAKNNLGVEALQFRRNKTTDKKEQWIYKNLVCYLHVFFKKDKDESDTSSEDDSDTEYITTEEFIKTKYPNIKMSDGYVKVSDICADKTKFKKFLQQTDTKHIIKVLKDKNFPEVLKFKINKSTDKKEQWIYKNLAYCLHIYLLDSSSEDSDTF